jgi:hypothetical protein
VPTLPPILPTPKPAPSPTPTPGSSCLVPPLCLSSTTTTAYDLNNVAVWGQLLVDWGSL